MSGKEGFSSSASATRRRAAAGAEYDRGDRPEIDGIQQPQVVHCLVLVALSVRMITQERQLHAKRIEEEWQRQIGQAGQDLFSRLERIKLSLVVAPTDAAPPAVVLAGTVHDGRLLLPWDANPNVRAFRQATAEPPFAH